MNTEVTLQLLQGQRDPRIRTLGFLALLAAVSVLSITTANECHSYFAVHHLNVSFIPSLLFGVTTWFWWIFIACGLWGYGTKRGLRFDWRELGRQILASIPLAILHLKLLQILVHVLSRHWAEWGLVYSTYKVGTGQRYGIEFMIYGFVYAVVGMLSLQRTNQEAAIRSVVLERQLSDAQLQALQMQMEPHFLFNTLNAIASLVVQKRNEEANETLDHLNTILRASLRTVRAKKIPLHEEIEVIESFLAIQQARFPEQLRVDMEISSDTLDGLVPPFLLQPLIENAVFHGIAASSSIGTIKTSVIRNADMLHLRVWNSAPDKPMAEHKGHGIGQNNTRERLGLFYAGRHEFHAGHLADGAYEVTITIPFETVAI